MKPVRKLAACSSGSFLRLRTFSVTYFPAHSDEAAFEGQAIVSEFVTPNETLNMKTIDSTVKALQNEICLSKLEQARQLSVGQRLLAGPELFDMGLMMMRSGIRMRYPEYNEKQVNNEIFRRLEIAKRIDDGDRYRLVDATDEQY